jgi:ketosteroid isomerase-like protein
MLVDRLCGRFCSCVPEELVPTQTLTVAALEAWLARYKQAWEQCDPAQAAALFTADAPYHEMPFDAPKAGRTGIRDYWATVTADQRNVDFKSQVVAVNGQTGVARWSASLTSAASGTRVELDGVFILRFDDSGLCSELREWWHVRTNP